MTHFTTNFKDFLAGVDLDTKDPNEVYALYSSVNQVTEYNNFKCWGEENQNDTKYFLTDGHYTLGMLTEKSRKAFLSVLTQEYCGGMDIDTWYSIKHEEARDEEDRQP